MILRTEAGAETSFTSERREWRACLGERIETSQEIWFVFTEDTLDELRRDPDVGKTRQGRLITGYGGVDKYYQQRETAADACAALRPAPDREERRRPG